MNSEDIFLFSEKKKTDSEKDSALFRIRPDTILMRFGHCFAFGIKVVSLPVVKKEMK